jgi:hypothetical protein
MTQRHPYALKIVTGLVPTPEIVAHFEVVLERQLNLCDELEGLADLLPDSIDAHTCLSAAQRLPVIVRHSHDFEEQTFYPAILSVASATREIAGCYDRLRYEHWGDEDYADDISFALREFIRTRPEANVESLSWMLRGFFAGVRRHLAFEREFVVPIAWQTVRVPPPE